MIEEFNELVNARYSCRDYSEKAVSRELVMSILETARQSPSACNKQPWKFLVIEELQLKEILHRSYDREWFKSAPLYIVALGNNKEAWIRPSDSKSYMDVDVAIAVENICLSATSFGLGSCWVCNFNKEILVEGLDITEDWEPIAIIPIGCPNDSNQNKKLRKPIDEIVKWGKF